ncbi:unnamed protein product [Acanthocheilonema viteae]|uniref:Doublecortin domain-containing protein n=1 Tax=Acanthocheilonema viteae TaxID=6277 RepID=A0A498SF63_ACAVI|nr:unnamed protein product [Acanthocheilonema viteae]
MRIKVYKNGDQYDTGTVVVICRKRFKHWLTFLDFLTKKLGLMAPVHEFYRTDGIRIRHFEEIENGESYVAVSQGPFLHKPYGLLSEDREKWNMNPKFESPGQSTLDSAESVDIYLKQRGYTSRTGLPFPFDGGVCVNHSLMELGRNRAPSSNQPIRQHRNEPKPQENNSKSGELLEKNDTKLESPREELENFNSQSISHANSDFTICNTNPPTSVAEPESETCTELKLNNEVETMNDQNIGQNDEILQNSSMIEVANASATKVGENDSCNEIATQNNCKPTVKEYDESVLAPVVQIPDSSRESPITQDAKNTESLGMMQMSNPNYCSSPVKNPETVITIVNDDAFISTSNSSIIIVNISTGQKKNNNIYNNDNKITDGAEITPSLVNKDKGVEVSSENSEAKMALLSDGTRTIDRMHDTIIETKTPMAIRISNALSAATTTDRLSVIPISTDDQRAKTVLLKKNENDEEDAKSFKRNSKEYSDNLLIRKNSKGNENNLANKFEESQMEQNLAIKSRENREPKINFEVKQGDKQDCDTSKNNAKLNEVSKNLNKSTPLPMQRSEFKENSDNSGHDKDDKKESRRTSIACGHEYASKNETQTTCAVSNSGKVQESLTTDKNSHNRKRVTLVTPSVAELNLERKSGKAETSSNSEGQLKSSLEQLAVDMNSANISLTTATSAITTTAITNTTTSSTMNDITQSTAASKDVIMHTTTGREKGNPKYQSEDGMSFEADFTPRNGRMQRNHIRMKSFQKIKIDLDLNMDTCRLPAQDSYDPDFKDYDFVQ